MTALMIPDALHAAIAEQAKEKGVTIGDHVKLLLNLGLNFYSTGSLPGTWQITPYSIGDKIGYLTVIGPAINDKTKKHRKMQLVRCPCGKTYSCRVERMKKGEVKSCGCMRNTAAIIMVDGIPTGLTVACKNAGIAMTTLANRRAKTGESNQIVFDYLRAKRIKKLAETDRRLQHMKEDTQWKSSVTG
jgi:hypothetical protein